MSDWYTVTHGDRNVRVAVATDDKSTWVFLDGHVWQIEKAPEGGGRRSKSRGDASVMAPMPATVVAIPVAIGEAVNEGDTIIVLEAMKMELPIKAPRAGEVRAIHCAKGDLVQPGVNLVEIA